MRYLFLVLAISFYMTLTGQGSPVLNASLWKKNLLINGNAEAKPEKKTIPGWKADTTQVRVREYGKGGLPADTNKYINSGGFYFSLAGANDSTTRSLRQEIDLREVADSIVKGKVTFFLAGNFGGKDSVAGVAFIVVTFYDTYGLAVENFNSIPVKRDERQKKSSLVYREIRGIVPVNAVKAVVQVKAHRDEPCAPKLSCVWEAYADNLSFMLLPFASEPGANGSKGMNIRDDDSRGRQ